MIWEGTTSGGPKILTQENFEDMIKSKSVFARKFDSLDVTTALLTEIKKQEGFV